MLKAGAYRTLAQQFDLDALHPNTHLYVGGGETPRWDFPGRVFRLREVVGFSKSEMRPLASLKQVNLAVRNFPATVAELRKRFKWGEGGDLYPLRLHLGRLGKSHPCSRENKKLRLANR